MSGFSAKDFLRVWREDDELIIDDDIDELK